MKIPTQIERLEKQIEQAQAELLWHQALKEKHESSRIRSQETRRKILLGSMILQLIGTGEEDGNAIREKLNRYLTCDDDRALFDLPPAQSENSYSETQS